MLNNVVLSAKVHIWFFFWSLSFGLYSQRKADTDLQVNQEIKTNKDCVSLISFLSSYKKIGISNVSWAWDQAAAYNAPCVSVLEKYNDNYYFKTYFNGKWSNKIQLTHQSRNMIKTWRLCNSVRQKMQIDVGICCQKYS